MTPDSTSVVVAILKKPYGNHCWCLPKVRREQVRSHAEWGGATAVRPSLQTFDEKVIDKQLSPRADVDQGFRLALAGGGSHGSQDRGVPVP